VVISLAFAIEIGGVGEEPERISLMCGAAACEEGGGGSSDDQVALCCPAYGSQLGHWGNAAA